MKFPITLEALEVLDAIARNGSFAAAASELYRVPSAISYTIQKLEQDLDVELFQKEGRKSVLTLAGQVLLEQGRDIVQAANRLAVATKKTHSGWEPVFNIAIDSILHFDFIYPLINRFYALQPAIEINIYEEVLGGACEAITRGRADLIIGAGSELVLQENIEIKSIQQIEWIFAVAPHHEVINAPLPLTLETMAQHRFVVVRDSARFQAPQSKRLFSACPVLSVPSLTEKIRAQMSGLGVGFLPKHRIRHLLEQGLLIALPVEHPIPADSIHMAWKSTNRGKVLLWFIEQLSEHQFL